MYFSPRVLVGRLHFSRDNSIGGCRVCICYVVGPDGRELGVSCARDLCGLCGSEFMIHVFVFFLASGGRSGRA